MGSGASGSPSAACRGDSATDAGVHSGYYEVHHEDELWQCEEFCKEHAQCTGIEFNREMHRCEVWTRPISTWAVPSLPGFECRRFGWPSRYLHPADGGEGRACRGESPLDNSEGYYELYQAKTLDQCKALCVAAPVCAGLEFSPGMARCEIWHTLIKATIPREGFTCLRYDPSLTVSVTLELGELSNGTETKCVSYPLKLIWCSEGVDRGTYGYRFGGTDRSEMVSISQVGNHVCMTGAEGYRSSEHESWPSMSVWCYAAAL